MPTLSKQKILSNFQLAELEFTNRWNTFAQGKQFSKFSLIFDDQIILQEFKELKQQRELLYYEDPAAQPLRSNPDYKCSQMLLEHGFYKAPHLAAFEYNASHSSYNSSNVTLYGHKFLALEGPQQPDHVDNFLMLLINYNVHKVVRLTADVENGVFKTENYWQTNILSDNHGQEYLNIRIKKEESDLPYTLPYYALDVWEDNKGIEPQVLLNLINAVRNNYTLGDLIAVHCSAGVGRTGTFIAGFILLHEIDKQFASGITKQDLQFSIEELVYKLSLQRAHLVGQPEQYLALHKVVSLYLDQI